MAAKNIEAIRLQEAREGKAPWKKWGPYLSETAVGHGARGLQLGRRRLGLLQPRSGPLPDLPLG